MRNNLCIRHVGTATHTPMKHPISASPAPIPSSTGTAQPWRAILLSSCTALLCAATVQAEQGPRTTTTGTEPKLSTTLEVPASTAAPQQEPDERSKATATAYRLLDDYFNQRYSSIGERLVISINLDDSEQVQGWPGRYRFKGAAVLRHYRDSSTDETMRRKELEIRETPGINAKKKYRLVERASFIRAETVSFEACVTGTGPDAALEFTLR